VVRAATLTVLLLLLAVAPAQANRTVGPDSLGNLHAFLVGADGRLYHAASTARGVWRPFEGLGGSLSPGPVAVGRNADGRLEVFARGTDNAVWHTWELAPGGAWSAWTSLGGPVAGPPDVGMNESNGLLEVFARGPDNALWHAWQNSPGGTWTQWSSLAGSLTSEPVVIHDSRGALVVFARWSDNTLYHIWQLQPASPWSAWAPLGGTLAGAPAPGLNSNGTLEAFARDTNGNGLIHRWQNAPLDGWVDQWYPLAGAQLAGDPSVASDVNGGLHVWARGSDNGLWHIWQDQPHAHWSAWSSPGGQFAGDPVIGSGREGLQVFALGTDGALYNSFQNGPSGDNWSPFVSLGRPQAATGSPPLTGAAPAGSPTRRLVVTLAFFAHAGKRITRLTSLVIKDAPRGATVSARCPRGCSRKSLVKRNIRSTKVVLSALIKRPLRVGTKITVTVTAPGTIGAVKTLTIRSRKEPKITTRCLPPGAAKPTTC
jgi:Repeat of unknown function (DUF346)